MDFNMFYLDYVDPLFGPDKRGDTKFLKDLRDFMDDANNKFAGVSIFRGATKTSHCLGYLLYKMCETKEKWVYISPNETLRTNCYFWLDAALRSDVITNAYSNKISIQTSTVKGGIRKRQDTLSGTEADFYLITPLGTAIGFHPDGGIADDLQPSDLGTHAQSIEEGPRLASRTLAWLNSVLYPAMSHASHTRILMPYTRKSPGDLYSEMLKSGVWDVFEIPVPAHDKYPTPDTYIIKKHTVKHSTRKPGQDYWEWFFSGENQIAIEAEMGPVAYAAEMKLKPIRNLFCQYPLDRLQTKYYSYYPNEFANSQHFIFCDPGNKTKGWAVCCVCKIGKSMFVQEVAYLRDGLHSVARTIREWKAKYRVANHDIFVEDNMGQGETRKEPLEEILGYIISDFTVVGEKFARIESAFDSMIGMQIGEEIPPFPCYMAINRDTEGLDDFEKQYERFPEESIRIKHDYDMMDITASAWNYIPEGGIL